MAAQLAPAIIDAQLEWLGIAAAERPELARKLGTPQCQQIAALRDRLGVDSDSETATAEKAALLAALREAVRTEAERRRRNREDLEWLGVPEAERPELAVTLPKALCEQIVELRARFGDDVSEEATAAKVALLAAVRVLLR